MLKTYKTLRSQINGDDLIQQDIALQKTTFRQTFPAYHAEAEHILSEMKRFGLPNAEIIEFPADGKTVYEDKIMPLGWDATVGRLTLQDKEHTVAADFSTEPFSLIKGSVSTAPGGEMMRIITQNQLLAGESPVNALVILNPDTRPAVNAFKPILDLGARGLISDYLPTRYYTPDEVHWANAATETDAWHVVDGDRPFIGFMVSPRMGDTIRKCATDGYLSAWVESDGHRYEDTFPAVTCCLPGRRPEELWLIAHTAEPFLDDDAAGIIACMEVMRRMMACGPHEYTLRLIFSLEVYGFAAYHAHFKGKAIGACNLDSIACRKHAIPVLIPPVPSIPWSGTALLQKLYDDLHGQVTLNPPTIPQCFDDMCLSDSTIGIPMVWFEFTSPGYPGYWHNSIQRKAEGFLDPEVFASSTACAATWTKFVLNTPVPEKVADIPLPPSPAPASLWRDYAEKQIYERATVGLPKDLARIPREFRRALPDGVMYGPMGTILSEIDGKRSLGEAIRRTEALRQTTIPEPLIKKYIDAVNYLTDWGYLKAVQRTELTQEALTEAIVKAGVCPGDILLVHASVSKCGYIQGGAKTLINAVRAAIGPTGTALFTTFVQSYQMLGKNVNRLWTFRPYDPKDISQIWTGEAGRTLLREFPEAVRSRHASHSWAGIGPQAAEILSKHGEADPPCGETSPLSEVLRRKGKILFVGSGIAPTTFLHYIETACHAAFLDQAVCSLRNPDGSTRLVLVEQHLPGHRNFYRTDAENSKFYQRAVAAGLTIRSAEFGLGKIQLINTEELWAIGSKLMKEDPNVLLCDDPNCLFCRQFNHQ